MIICACVCVCIMLKCMCAHHCKSEYASGSLCMYISSFCLCANVCNWFYVSGKMYPHGSRMHLAYARVGMYSLILGGVLPRYRTPYASTRLSACTRIQLIECACVCVRECEGSLVRVSVLVL